MTKSKYIAKALYELLEEGRDTEKVMSQFEVFVQKYRIEPYLRGIVRHLEFIAKKKRETDTALVESAEVLDKGTIDQILGVMQVDAEVRQQVDEGLIGGFVLKYKGVRYDRSIAYQLEKIKKALASEYTI